MKSTLDAIYHKLDITAENISELKELGLEIIEKFKKEE
jgi:hypothetical protein